MWCFPDLIKSMLSDAVTIILCKSVYYAAPSIRECSYALIWLSIKAALTFSFLPTVYSLTSALFKKEPY